MSIFDITLILRNMFESDFKKKGLNACIMIQTQVEFTKFINNNKNRILNLKIKH
jgi:hypothetical protein